MTSLRDFIAARLEEDRDAALSGEFGDLRFGGVNLEASLRNQDRTLREAHAKEAILDEHSGVHSCGADHATDDDPCDTLKYLAAIYSDHESYRKEWAA